MIGLYQFLHFLNFKMFFVVRCFELIQFTENLVGFHPELSAAVVNG